ncbi:N-acetylmuramoyl-L-alanine amidase [Bacillus thermotolerans]|uniref:N-acetylmuramoyl-L-alanine amidase n=1 Tax=Bacillus thermotolerans TaxID=1221996 RepID=A0A0F5IDU1_BACTR|nr:N-acetylmuramoyl-L-alanine amidase [Bacillus thermotolerans]KKB43342.1 N-acetylmuramoyl-L-alanine amidase [Bacillus thermotolerans]
MKKNVTIVMLIFSLVISSFSFYTSAEASGFADVPSRAAKEVNYLAERKIANGLSPSVFGAEQAVTRAEAAAFIGRALQLNGTKRSTSFKDVSSGNFASGYIQSAVERGVLSGYDGGYFRPEQKVTRGEMAVMISKAFGYPYGGTLTGAASALMSRGIANGMEDGTFGAGQSILRVDFAVFLARTMNPAFRVKSTSSYTQVAPSVMNKVDPRLASQVVILDPGHGGKDPGAVGFGLKEKDVVLDTGLKVNELLKKTPLQVHMTRTGDTFPSLSDRTNFAKSKGGDLFLSIHANAFNGSANGTETFYYSSSATNQYVSDSKLLAEKIQRRMLMAWNLQDRGVKQTSKLYVLKYNDMPAALAELGFIDQESDNQKLKSEYWRTAVAKAIYYGIIDYYNAKGYEVDALYNVAK